MVGAMRPCGYLRCRWGGGQENVLVFIQGAGGGGGCPGGCDESHLIAHLTPEDNPEPPLSRNSDTVLRIKQGPSLAQSSLIHMRDLA